jgi:oligopeptidase B
MRQQRRPAGWCLALGLLLAAVPVGAFAQDIHPPAAERRPMTLENHGDVRTDMYFWMRDRESPEVIAHLEAENAWFEAQMAPLAGLQDELFDEIRERIPQDDASVPFRLGEHFYYRRTVEGRQYPIHARRAGSLEAPEQVLLDVNALAEGHDYYGALVGSASISPDGRLLAWAADTTGRRFYTIRFLDMTTGEMLPDEIPNVTGNLAWAADSHTLLYSKQDPETLRWDRIYRRELGADPASDKLVYTEGDDTFGTFVTKTSDHRYLLIGSSHTLTSEWRVLGADEPAGEPRVFEPRERGHEYDIDHAKGVFYVRTNLDAENFRLMRAPDHSTSREHWEEVIAHRDDVFLVGFMPLRDHLVVTERAGGLDRLRIRPWDDPNAEHYIAFDDAAYGVSLGDNPRFGTDTLRFVYQSPAVPVTTYDYDMTTRARTLLKRDEVRGGFDASNYHTERLTVPARDGAGVPVTLVYRKDRFAKDGSSPLLLYGYGSYGFSIPPFFDPQRISLLDRGFAYAIAHIRGSQTLGRRWYEEGKLLKKKNTFTDFIDIADHLVAEGYADPARLYAMGGSAGGLLMGAVMNMRPELFHGVIAHVPWVDIVTTMLDASIPLTTSEYDEWGDPNDPEHYRYMLSYSPYDNVRPAAYPHLLVTTGLHDSQVQYWEPAKWVAKLRELKTNDALLLLHTDMGAGHGGASGRLDRYRETARDYAFLLHLAGVGDLVRRKPPTADP